MKSILFKLCWVFLGFVFTALVLCLILLDDADEWTEQAQSLSHERKWKMAGEEGIGLCADAMVFKQPIHLGDKLANRDATAEVVSIKKRWLAGDTELLLHLPSEDIICRYVSK